MNELAGYAMTESQTRGRRFVESEPVYRTIYQRDRDRIIHCGAFRRLEYKTQVFANHSGDFYRTRLTHTLEVMQIARTLARALRVNEDLVEALALAHDVGHPPFGHCGELCLSELIKGQGGFNHNVHGLRIVDILEERYPDFTGLNLTLETREGFARHSRQAIMVEPSFAEFRALGGALIEQQIVEVADGIAYNNHDLDDGLYSGIINERDLAATDLWRTTAKNRPDCSDKIWRQVIIRRLIDTLTNDVIDTTRRNIARLKIDSLTAVRAASEPIVALSAPMAAREIELKKFLQQNFYNSSVVQAMRSKARQFITALFAAYWENPHLLPVKYRPSENSESAPRLIADYLAGMTDRFVEKEYQKLFLPHQ